MITDPIFYRLFETSPETFFQLLGMPADTAQAMAGRYEYQALEFKETAHRADGVFQPQEPGLPIYTPSPYPLPRRKQQMEDSSGGEGRVRGCNSIPCPASMRTCWPKPTLI